MNPGWIEPDWPAPAGVRAVSTLRSGGISQGPYASLNLGNHVGDDEAAVAGNRQRLSLALTLPSEPVWLNQVHGQGVVRIGPTERLAPVPTADAAFTGERGVVCAVMTADCLPVLLCSADGSSVAAVHAGWRGLVGGVIEATLEQMDDRPTLAWLGPALGPEAFEVGDEVRQAFLAKNPAHAEFFRARPISGKWLADLYGLARTVLQTQGITALYGGQHCTASEPEHFFSYRRDGGVTGRMASLIWRFPDQPGFIPDSRD